MESASLCGLCLTPGSASHSTGQQNHPSTSMKRVSRIQFRLPFCIAGVSLCFSPADKSAISIRCLSTCQTRWGPVRLRRAIRLFLYLSFWHALPNCGLTSWSQNPSQVQWRQEMSRQSSWSFQIMRDKNRAWGGQRDFGFSNLAKSLPLCSSKFLKLLCLAF